MHSEHIPGTAHIHSLRGEGTICPGHQFSFSSFRHLHRNQKLIVYFRFSLMWMDDKITGMQNKRAQQHVAKMKRRGLNYKLSSSSRRRLQSSFARTILIMYIDRIPSFHKELSLLAVPFSPLAELVAANIPMGNAINMSAILLQTDHHFMRCNCRFAMAPLLIC